MALLRDAPSFPPSSTLELPADDFGPPPSAESALHQSTHINTARSTVSDLQPYGALTQTPRADPPATVIRKSPYTTSSHSTTLVAFATSSPSLGADTKFMADQHHDPDPEKHTSHAFIPPSNTPGSQARPLIDLVTNDWQNVIDDSDDEEYYRRKSETVGMHTRWKQTAVGPTNRLSQIPRRVQRYFVIYATLLVAAWLSWKFFMQANWESNRAIDKSLDEPSKVFFGANMRPEFSDMVHIKTMDSRLLPTDENFKQRLVIVGDVHGCKDELQALLDKVKFRAPHDHLILTGDIISKGPDSSGVVSLARSLSASCVRGNHEDRMLLALADMRSHHAALPGPAEDATTSTDLLDEESFSHGDYAFRSLAREFDDQQIKWLQACPVILRVGEIAGFGEMVVVHAGLVPGIPLERQDPFHVMNMRTIDLETRLPSENREGTPWEKLWNRYQSRVPKHSSERSTVVYGHDSKRGRNIQRYSFGLDSGCVAGGKLTALVIEAASKGKKAKTSIVDVKCKTDWKSKNKSQSKEKTET